jgi:large subunit ribosomal protein L15
MKIHELPGDPGRRQKRKRLGRGHGSGQGKTAGKGHKGSKARSGHSKGTDDGFEGGQMPIQRRLPKGGFKNPFRVEYAVVNLSSIEKFFEAGAVIDRASLEKAGLIKGPLPVKVLGNGELSKAVTVRAEKVSKSAGEKIAKAGGSFEEVLKDSGVATVRLSSIDKAFEAGATVDRAALVAAGLLKEAKKDLPIRVTARSHGGSELTKTLTVRVDEVTPTAAAKIQAAGGSC